MTTYYEDREKESFAKLCALVKSLGIKKPMIFDVGANAGQSLTAFREVFDDYTVHSFEPNPAMLKILAEKWGSESDVFLHGEALNSVSGTAPFHVTKVPEASSLLHPHPKLMNLSVDNKYDIEKIDIKCITVDNFCTSHQIDTVDLMKIDVQGAELEVLKGADQFLAAGKVSVLYIESTFAESYRHQMKFEDLLLFCSQRGYQLWDLSPFLYTRTGRLWTANTIFLSNHAITEVEANYAEK